jgi:hypothetical protein
MVSFTYTFEASSVCQLSVFCTPATRLLKSPTSPCGVEMNPGENGSFVAEAL